MKEIGKISFSVLLVHWLVLYRIVGDILGISAMSFGIMSIPTLILFRGGKPVAQRIGLQNTAALEQLIKE